MTNGQTLILGILIGTMAMFLWGRWRHDMVAAGALLACVLGGLVSPQAAFAGFGHPAVITVACVLVLSRGLQTSGAVDVLARFVLPANAGPTVSIAALVGLGAVLSGFMNNVGAMALLMPVAIQMAARQDLPPGRVLMPLAFGTILGGMTTLIGTPPNLIVSGFRAQTGAGTFAMFDFTPVGLAVAATCIVFVALVGWRLVPERRQPGGEGFDTGAYLTEARVPENGKAAGKSLREIEAVLDDAEAQVVGLIRNEVRVTAPHSGRIVKAGDILVIEAEADMLANALSSLGLKLEEAEPDEGEGEGEGEREAEGNGGDGGKGDEKSDARGDGEVDSKSDAKGYARGDAKSPLKGGSRGVAKLVEKVVEKVADKAAEKAAEKAAKKGEAGRDPKGDADEDAKDGDAADEKAERTDEIVLAEFAVLPQSALISRSAQDVLLRSRYSLNLLAVSRQGQRSKTRLRTLPFAAGDLLLLQGPPEALAEFAADSGCVPLAERELRIPDRRKALVATGIMAASVGGAAFGLLPAAISFAAGVLASMALRTVPPRSVYDAIDWPVIVLLAALIPVAGAMESTGTAGLIARFLLDGIARGHAIGALALILVVTMMLSDVMNNAATAAVMCPIAIGTAAVLGLNADPFLMAVAIGASCAFLTPIGHQNNTLILGPGGFRFGDYWRLGVPVELLVIAISVPMLLVVWPL